MPRLSIPSTLVRTLRDVALLLMLSSPAAHAQAGSPAEALGNWNPNLFSPGTVVDAAAGGSVGARIVHATQALSRLGFREGDVVLAVAGRTFAEGAPIVLGQDAVYTVLRAVRGERPVLSADVLGLQVVVQFVDLPARERTPMRLARMAANQRTLVRDGFGIVLVPSGANDSDSEWLRVANPMPSISESALRDVADAVVARTSLPSRAPDEAAAAASALESRKFFEARERAARALLQLVTEPERRTEVDVLQSAAETFRAASRGVERERQILLASGHRFGVFAMGAIHHVKENLPQNTMLLLDAATSVSFTAGVRMGLFWPSERGGWPVWRDLHVVASYGYARHTFEGPPLQNQPGSEPRMRTRSHRLSGELMFTPRVLSRLRPHFRGGPALFHITAGAYDTNDVLRDEYQDWELGWVLGAGLDVYNSRERRFRVTLTGDYQIVSTSYCEFITPNWIDASNIIEQDVLERPSSPACGVPGEDAFYIVDLEGFQFGLAFSYEF